MGPAGIMSASFAANFSADLFEHSDQAHIEKLKDLSLFIQCLRPQLLSETPC